MDDACSALRDVSGFRILVRCANVDSIPSFLSLWVEDRRFRVSVVVESWVAADPILLGEATDQRLGLTSREDQDLFAARMEAAPPAHPAISGGKGLLPSARSGQSGLGFYPPEANTTLGPGGPPVGASRAPPTLQQIPPLSTGLAGDQGGPRVLEYPLPSPEEGLDSSSFTPLVPSPAGHLGTIPQPGSLVDDCPSASSSARGGGAGS